MGFCMLLGDSACMGFCMLTVLLLVEEGQCKWDDGGFSIMRNIGGIVFIFYNFAVCFHLVIVDDNKDIVLAVFVSSQECIHDFIGF